MHAPDADLHAALEAARQGDRRALARLISAAERGQALPPLPLPGSEADTQLCIGITGAPGAGKSTLVGALVDALLREEARAAVLAVDPSSPLSRGALLGDRVRMHRHATAANVFIRSMATRSQHGGLAAATQTARRLLQHCGWPLVLIETVGVGQVELDVVKTADIAVVVLNPGWGDEIQANKAGLMEIADVFVINKADRPGLEATRRDIEAVLINRPASARPAIVETVATEGRGIDALAEAIGDVRRQLLARGLLAERRRAQLRQELEQEAARRFSAALARAGDNGTTAAVLARVATGRTSIPDGADELLRGLLRATSDDHGGSGEAHADE